MVFPGEDGRIQPPSPCLTFFFLCFSLQVTRCTPHASVPQSTSSVGITLPRSWRQGSGTILMYVSCMLRMPLRKRRCDRLKL
ncbi:hypothetical protein HDV57DRAFT_504567 [Trichoderma longibrachiatum]